MDIKCSSKIHKDINASIYCQECRLYLCKKCQHFHEESYDHHLINLSNDNDDFFTGICKEKNHINELIYYCKNHNKLCCASCIVKLPEEGNGQHTNCDICFIKDIKDEKKKILNENIKSLEQLSQNLHDSIKELKDIFDKIYENKDSIKSKIQIIFTKIRNILNEREDELLLEIDKICDNLFYKEESVKKSEKLPNYINKCLEKSKIIINEWDEKNKLNSLINDCINLENCIEEVNNIKETIKKCKSVYPDLKFNLHGLDTISENIKIFGEIYNRNFIFKQSKNKEDYSITGENENIITKISDKKWIYIQSENELKNDLNYTWKIKILNSANKYIMVGISPKLSDNLSENLDSSFIIAHSSVAKYTITNPFIASYRDNIVGEDFPVIPGSTYRVKMKAKRIFGKIDIQGGIYYNSPDCVEGWPGYFEKIKEKSDTEYYTYYKDIKIPSDKKRGKFFFQIEQDHKGGAASWAIADISISKVGKKNNSIDGYYFYLNNSSFYSGLPHKYFNKITELNMIKKEVKIIINMKNKILKFRIDDEEKEAVYNDISIKKPLFPTIILYDKNDSFQFIG